MTRSFAVLLLLALFAGASFAAEPVLTPPPEQKMEVQVFKVMPYEFCDPLLSQDKGPRKYAKGVDPMDDSGNRFDVTKYFTAAGVQFPPGSEAVYFKNAGSVYVRSTRYNLDMIDQILLGGFWDPPFLVDVELSAMECSLPGGKMLPSSGRLAYDDFARLAGKTMKLLDRVSLLQKSGEHGSASHVTNPAPGTPAPGKTSRGALPKSFAAGESGTLAEIEPVISRNGDVVTVKIDYRFQQAAERKPAGPASTIILHTSFVMWDDVPVLVHLSPVPGHEGKYIAMVARARLTTLDGGSRRALYDMDKKSAPDPAKPAPELPKPTP